MAKLRLTLHDISCYNDETPKSLGLRNLSVSTEKDTDKAFFKKDDKGIYQYLLTLVDFGFKKKMYQPTEIIAKIQLSMAAGPTAEWKTLSREVLDKLFKFKKVKLEERSGDQTLQTLGEDFYVHEVLVHKKPTSMYVTLKIYSLDKLMTLKQASRTFVAQKLGEDVLNTEIKKYIQPWTIQEKIPTLKKDIEEKNAKINDLNAKILTDPGNATQYNTEVEKLTKEVGNLQKEKEGLESKQKAMTCSFDNMQQLKYKKGDTTVEHIHPYLVQYNESFYDMLARTANRWGEFLYYEDGKLNIGYAYDKDNKDNNKVTKITNNYGDITYVDLDSIKAVVAEDGKYDYAGADEKGFINNILRKTPNSVSGILFKPGEKGDKVAMKIIRSFLKNEKNLPTYMAGLAFDSTYELLVSEFANVKENNDFDEEWFPKKDKPCKDEHYGEHNFGSEEKPDNGTGVNLFSEIDSKYKESTYTKILAKEQSVGRNAVCIDFQTYCPELKLGSIIEIDEEQFIVVEISSKIDKYRKYKTNLETGAVTAETISALVFQVIATAQNSEDKKFYPAVIPAGHVREAGPQVATIADADDPSGKNRVRVLFPWQNDQDTSSPWLTFTAGGAGSPVVGKHYVDDKVMIGFIDDNVERPYVLGSVTSKGDFADYVQTTPGGHKFTMQDDEEGIANFLTGMFLPGVNTLLPAVSLIPGFNGFKEAVLKPSKNNKNNIALGGGFELADKYGIYKISGSTDGREVAIASPWGKVNINAFSGITISAPNGDVCIKGKNVSIEAGNNLEITSGTNVKYKLFGESLDKGAGNVASAFFGNMAGAVSKKLAQTALNMVDLSMVRNVLDIVFRPAEGNMRIKSNRYMMLESGRGECDYPADAYKDDKTVQELIKKQEKLGLRPGLKLASGVTEMIAKVQTLGNQVESDYRKAYNKCCDLRKQYDDMCAKAKRWSDVYDRNKTREENAAICSTYDEIKAKVWKADPAIAVDDLGWKNFAITDADVKPKALENYKVRVGDRRWRDMLPGTRKTNIINRRMKYKAELLEIAVSLQKAIADLQKMSGLSEKDIKAQIGAWKDRNISENFRKALVTAFDKEKLGDTFFYKAIADDKKDLTNKYNVDDLKSQRKALKRKAAIILLEEMGFKDEWRKDLKDLNAPPAVPPALGVSLPLPVGLIPPPPVSPLRKIPKKTNEADLADTNDGNKYWSEYVQSLSAVPPLSPTKWKVFEEAKKVAHGALDNLYVWKNIKENKSWGEAKKGAILFSSNSSVYQLKNNTIEEVNVVGKECLEETDDIVANGPVNTFLDKIRAKLNTLD